MTRSTRIGIALVLAVGALLAGGAAWWRKQHSYRGVEYEVPAAQPAAPTRVRLVTVAVNVDRPTDIRFVPGGGTRAVVLEQGGKARLLDLAAPLAGGAPVDAKNAPLVLDVWVRAVAEQGLIGLAFHPRYAERGTFYVYYHPWIHNDGQSRIAEMELPLAELGTRVAVEKRALLELKQELTVHQGGGLAFGPDGKLYVGLGDGATANDPNGDAQNLGSLKGKVLRLDVDGESVVPSDNPFVNREGARPEIFAYGLRNPWRMSFDSAGRLIVGDVGQEAREELDLVSAGANMGWNYREGRICSQTSPQCPTEGLVDPILDYERTTGTSITAGYEVTGSRVPGLQGRYVFADFVFGRMWSIRLPSAAPAAGAPPEDLGQELLGQWPRLFSSFGRDDAGNVYVTDIANGEILALMPDTR